MDYYKQELFIPQVNEQDEIQGKVERWKAHQEGILHRGFTVGVLYEGQMLCQHRKHPVFDSFLDLTASSHPIYTGDDLQDMTEAVEKCLLREWNIKSEELSYKPKLAGKVVYDSRHEDFVEHEVCHLYITEVKKLPMPVLEFAYGFSLLPLEQFNDVKKYPLLNGLAPWVEAMIMQGLLKNLT
jgi:isopentenyldiphosphate isomerase